MQVIKTQWLLAAGNSWTPLWHWSWLWSLSKQVASNHTSAFLCLTRLQCSPGPGWGTQTQCFAVRWPPLERYVVKICCNLLFYLIHSNGQLHISSVCLCFLEGGLFWTKHLHSLPEGHALHRLQATAEGHPDRDSGRTTAIWNSTRLLFSPPVSFRCVLLLRNRWLESLRLIGFSLRQNDGPPDVSHPFPPWFLRLSANTRDAKAHSSTNGPEWLIRLSWHDCIERNSSRVQSLLLRVGKSEHWCDHSLKMCP